MNNSVKTRPQRRLTQAELDAFLAKAADTSGRTQTFIPANLAGGIRSLRTNAFLWLRKKNREALIERLENGAKAGSNEINRYPKEMPFF
jgi:hypothetical protein